MKKTEMTGAKEGIGGCLMRPERKKGATSKRHVQKSSGKKEQEELITKHKKRGDRRGEGGTQGAQAGR